jgi:hypothetical protein
MKVKVRNTLLLVSLIIVLIIIIDLIFNITGIVVEKFTNDTPNPNGDASTSDVDTSKIKSIISKFDGKMVNVVFLDNTVNNNLVCISSPVAENANISVNTDGTLSQELKMTSNPSQQFKIIKIINSQEYSNQLEPNSLGANEFDDNIKYPFYILKSVRMDGWCLAYEPGNLFLMPIGNYNNQKWDVSNIRNPSISIMTHEVQETSIGSLNKNGNGSSEELFDPNKIKININLTDEIKKQLGITDESNTELNSASNGSTYSQKCSNQIPRSALSSLCRGCDPEKI